MAFRAARRDLSAVERVGVYAGLAALGGFALFPVYWMGVTSVLPQDSIFRDPPAFFPLDAQLGGYVHVWRESGLPQWILNSALVVLVSTALSAVVAVLAGYALSRFRSGLGATIGYLLLASRLVPSTLWVIPLYVVYQSAGLLDTYTAVILAYATFEYPLRHVDAQGLLRQHPAGTGPSGPTRRLLRADEPRASDPPDRPAGHRGQLDGLGDPGLERLPLRPDLLARPGSLDRDGRHSIAFR